MITKEQYEYLKRHLLRTQRGMTVNNDKTDIETAYRIGRIAAYQEIYTLLLELELNDDKDSR